MNEATKQALEQFVTKMLAAAEQGASWTADQAPLVVQEWLRWQMVDNVVWALMLLIPIYGAWRLGGSMIKAATEYDDEPKVAGWAVRAVLGGLLSLSAAACALDAIKTVVAPRVVVLEKFAELVSEKK